MDEAEPSPLLVSIRGSIFMSLGFSSGPVLVFMVTPRFYLFGDVTDFQLFDAQPLILGFTQFFLILIKAKHFAYNRLNRVPRGLNPEKIVG